MALAASFLILGCLCGFLLGFISLGSFILRGLSGEYVFSDVEHLLISAAIGLTASEILFFILQPTNLFKVSAWVLICIMALALIAEKKRVVRCLLDSRRKMQPHSKVDRFLFVTIAIAASVEFLASMAPLTGSDALHYHFAVEKLILQGGFHPIWSNSHSFLCGQQHLLILLGLSLGSERLALGFICLGGILSAASMGFLVSRWTSYKITALIILVFLLTPVVFWQITTSGAPDIYMAFLVCVAIIILTKQFETTSWQQVALAGLLVGGIAGSKYTGCVLAAAFLIAVSIEFHSISTIGTFVLASLVSGCWPYLRNILWTGNPVFPFLSTLFPSRFVNAYVLSDLANDTGAASAHHISQIIPFVFFAGLHTENLGFWSFFGPTVLSIAPLAFLAFKNCRAWRIPLLVWILSAVAMFYTSGLPRFLLPIYPIALLFAGFGVDIVSRSKWATSKSIALAVVIFAIVSGVAGLLVYSQHSLVAAAGLEGRIQYLEQTSQEYKVVEAVNRLLKGQATSQNQALVFIRHTYYLDVPYLNGNPGTGFLVDPTVLKTPAEWKLFLDDQSIGYVVRSPDYPKTIAGPLIEMEKSGELTPVQELEVEDLRGKRIDQNLNTIKVVIFKVRR
jgi:hypothetical protein